jgi:hypothetical protein
VRADELFVFAGAGVSVSAPTGLPAFVWMRDELLRQVGLTSYLNGPDGDPAHVAVARGLLPEPFLQDLDRSGVDIQGWLSTLMAGRRPNAVHVALAQLAAAGAKVWTVNFDEAIELAGGNRLKVAAWPRASDGAVELVKPHGTCSGPMIFTADEVVAPLGEHWRDSLAEHVRERHVIFVGYSGNDLDFRPVWDEVLEAALDVTWFDFWDDVGTAPQPRDRIRKELLLRRVNERGALEFALPATPPPGYTPNPSCDFVTWLQARGLVHVEPDRVEQLFDLAEPEYPTLQGDRRLAAAALQATLGDFGGARSRLLHLVGTRRAPVAVRRLARLQASHGKLATAAVLAAAAVIPPVGPLREPRAAALRKRLTILANVGDYKKVLRATARTRPRHVSTERILRAQALRITGSLDDAARTASEAFDQAIAERHAVRTAHAAFQLAISLLWAERLDECRECLDRRTDPYAQIAANRWVAWAAFVRACLLVREDSSVAEALALFDDAEQRFAAEHLMDGIVSVRVSRLAALRRSDDSGYASQWREAEALARAGRDGSMYYSQGHRFTQAALALDAAEHTRVHLGDRERAGAMYRDLASSPYPLIAAFAELGLALSCDGAEQAAACKRALEIGTGIGARLVADRARQLSRDASATAEVFFC